MMLRFERVQCFLSTSALLHSEAPPLCLRKQLVFGKRVPHLGRENDVSEEEHDHAKRRPKARFTHSRAR